MENHLTSSSNNHNNNSSDNNEAHEMETNDCHLPSPIKIGHHLHPDHDGDHHHHHHERADEMLVQVPHDDDHHYDHAVATALQDMTDGVNDDVAEFSTAALDASDAGSSSNTAAANFGGGGVTATTTKRDHDQFQLMQQVDGSDLVGVEEISHQEPEDGPVGKRQKLLLKGGLTTTTATAAAPLLGTNIVTAAATATNKKVNHEQWAAMFERLVAYKAEHKDCLVPKRYAADPKLGTWVETQRVQYKRLNRDVDQASGVEAVTPNNRLNIERLAKLESIGFAWSAKNVRRSSTEPTPTTRTGGLAEGGSTGILPETNNSSKKKPSPSSPSEDGVVGVPIHARASSCSHMSDNQWDEMYQRLVEYKEKYGDCLIPRKYERDMKLAAWVETQRVLWNREYRESIGATNTNTNNLANDSLPLPEPATVAVTAGTSSLADPLEVRSPEDWVLEMVRQSQENQPPESGGGATVEDAAEIAATMAEEEVAIPGALGKQNIAAVETAAAAVASDTTSLEGTDLVGLEQRGEDTNIIDNKSTVAPTLLMQQSQPKILTQERKDKLDALNFVWSLRTKRIDDHWDEMFKQLTVYKEKHGDCLVPSRYEENLKLGKWAETQRYEYTKLQRASGGPNVSSTEIRIDSKPRPANSRLTEERLRRLKSIGFEWKVKHKMKRYFDKQWDQMFDRLLKFKEEKGHCMVPKRYPPDIKLGTWVHTQRIQYRKLTTGATKKDVQKHTVAPVQKGGEEVNYRLTEDRRKRLEEVGFAWSVRESENGSEQGRIIRNSYDDQWDAMFNRLKEYKESNGHCLVPKRCKEDPKLGTWVDTQRVQYKKMKKKLASQGIIYQGPNQMAGSIKNETPAILAKPVIGRLTDDRINRLENLGFVWSLRDDWQKHYEELKEYKGIHNDCNVPARYSKNRRLGIWVSAQRQQFKLIQTQRDANKPRRSSSLTQERIDLLNLLGFTWAIRSRDSFGESWNHRLQDLREYKATHGNCLVPSRYQPNPELGVWVGTQRTQYRLFMKSKESGNPIPGASSMNEDRIRQLEEVGFVWALRGGEGGKRELDVDPLDEAIAANEIEQEAMHVVGAFVPGDIHHHHDVSHDTDHQGEVSILQSTETQVSSEAQVVHGTDSILGEMIH